MAVDGDRPLWPPAARALVLDLGYRREFGGLVLRWDGRAGASDYDVALSDDGRDWRTVRECAAATAAATGSG